MADITIDVDKCDNCRDCTDVCPMEVLILEDGKLTINNLMDVVTAKPVWIFAPTNASQ